MKKGHGIPGSEKENLYTGVPNNLNGFYFLHIKYAECTLISFHFKNKTSVKDQGRYYTL